MIKDWINLFEIEIEIEKNSRQGVNGSPSSCHGENEKFLTTSEINKYIGAPLKIKWLSNSLSKYFQEFKSLFSFIKDPEPISVTFYVIFVNLIQNTGGCVTAAEKK